MPLCPEASKISIQQYQSLLPSISDLPQTLFPKLIYLPPSHRLLESWEQQDLQISFRLWAQLAEGAAREEPEAVIAPVPARSSTPYRTHTTASKSSGNHGFLLVVKLKPSPLPEGTLNSLSLSITREGCFWSQPSQSCQSPTHSHFLLQGGKDQFFHFREPSPRSQRACPTASAVHNPLFPGPTSTVESSAWGPLSTSTVAEREASGPSLSSSPPHTPATPQSHTTGPQPIANEQKKPLTSQIRPVTALNSLFFLFKALEGNPQSESFLRVETMFLNHSVITTAPPKKAPNRS